MKPVFNLNDIECTAIDTSRYSEKKIKLLVARLDTIHPVVSGNKLFKLYYFVEEALQSTQKTILTFGGAWSNHLVATAYACKVNGLRSIGIVRGEAAEKLSVTLNDCIAYGMQLKFISREQYASKDDEIFLQQLKNEFGDCTIVPEGGYHPTGARGASLIMDMIKMQNADYVCTAIGTATTFAGLMQQQDAAKKIIGIPVLKNMTDIPERVRYLNNRFVDESNLWTDYHFGGYAKYNQALLDFMNELFTNHHLPTDFVYTGKMMYAVIDKIKQDFFDNHSTIICLHTGGLQGNGSFAAGTLVF